MTDRESIRPFFDKTGYDHTTLVHCAAVVTIASKANPAVWSVNVGGTSNVMQLALENQTDRVIYVSSVHAIPERPGAEVITEVDHFSPDAVCGQYAKAKAAATQMVLEYAKRGLNVSVVHPSGIIGPGDFYVKNHMIKTIRAMAKGTIPVSISGGFDFVDSRDVAEGILRMRRYREDEAKCAAKCAALLERMGLSDIRDMKAGNLPYGLQRRLEIARALATEPRLLLLDEPAAGMNDEESEEMSRTIRRIRDEFEDITVIVIDHHMDVIMDVCEKISVINFGRQIACGASAEIQDDQEVIDAYLGTGD